MKSLKSWTDPSKYLQHIYVEESCIDLEYTKEILERSRLPFTILEDRQQPSGFEDFAGSMTKGKQQLVLGENRGTFLKSCPATREYRCCDYQVLNIGMNCPMDCVYCILQAYLNNPWISFFVNIDKMFLEMDTAFSERETEYFRIGTGEFTDSLALDRLTNLSSRLVDYMADKPRGILELKTKSAFIDNLKGLNHKGKTVVSWSLNSKTVMVKEEFRVATLKERLSAAKRCAEWGYHIGFHFDPIVIHDNWKEEYCATIREIYNYIPAEQIAWISIGALRFLPDLKHIGHERFPKSKMFFQEFIEGLDGKSRYFRTERTEMYKILHDELKKHAADRTCIYFCMESDEIWKDVFGFTPEEKGGLPAMLDRAVFTELNE